MIMGKFDQYMKDLYTENDKTLSEITEANKISCC